MTIALYPGTFDPVTNGHVGIAHRANILFDKVYVAVYEGAEESTCFDVEQRKALTCVALAEETNIEVITFNGLTIDLATELNAKAIIRGLRSVTDFDYEAQLADFYKRMNSNLETVFLMPSQDCRYLSSSMVREIAFHGGDVSPFVHQDVNNALIQYKNNR